MDADVNPQVIEYLSKKGYSKTESMLRQESANQDVEGRPINTKAEETGGAKYGKAFGLMRSWIEESLDIYKPDLRRLLWPIFVYSFLNLASDFFPRDSRLFFESFKSGFGKEHEDDLRALQPIEIPEHVLNHDTAKIYRNNKYRITLSQVAFFNLVQFLESKGKDGGAVIVGVIQSYLQIVTIDRVADDQNSLARLLQRAKANEDYPAEDEGIPGHNPGSANVDRSAGSTVLTRLKLGRMPLESDLMGDVRAELEEEDAKNPPGTGQDSFVQHFEQRIKREDSEDAPTRSELQLPPSVARDVAMEVQKVKEDRDRFKIEGRTGGVGPGISVTMFTFHNTYDSVNCLDFSEDNMLVAAGMSESYIRVWSLDGKALPTTVHPGSTERAPFASRRLIGHSGPVYAVSFSPSIASSNPLAPSTNSKHLLSCSADKSVRLWSLETWTCLVIYKGHDHPVWDVKWGPFGLYFLTGSLDRTCRLWRTDHIEDLRMFVGHDKDVDTVCFHPNSAYVFTGSSDRIVRMWAVANGYPVRMFTGHTGNITSLACSPSGKILASSDDAGTIILWDLGPGKLKKRMRGHGKGGIWSLSWSVESTVLASGGADGTVRIWDITVGNDASGQGRVIGEGGAGQKIDGNAAQMQAVAGAGTKKKGKDVVVTSDQISAFPTKKSPVYKVRFTRQNLVVAGGAFLS
ncbi:MAG: Transcription initiation factor TFIID subunit 5 [Alectoria sarmentosa]|nr:MAG: Transcription initiation factor TFIID subunit 5 [Alectoria sarmentosa]